MNLRHWLRPLVSPRPAVRADRSCLGVEPLESRDVPTAVAVPDGLVSWWTGNNTPADATGANNATLSTVTYATGEVGKAFNFNGSNGWAALGDPASLAFTSSFTIEGWVKVNGIPTSYNFGSIMFRGDDRGGLDPYSLDLLPDGRLRFEVCGTNGTADVYAPVPIGQFVHVAATLDDATGAMKLYENGVVVAQTTTATRPFAALDPTQQPGVGIGNSNALSNYNVPFNGLIDELSVYNLALTPSEVLGITRAGSSGKVFSPVSVDGPSVVEGAAGTTTPVTFTIKRTGSLSGSLTVNWATADDTAVAGSDYAAAAGSVTFADGEATKTVTVLVNGDSTVEPSETFKLVVTPTGGTAVMGVATILTDDVAVSVSDAAATEGDTSLRNLGHFVNPLSGGLARSRGSTFGPDGNFYVASGDTNSILRYDPTGAFIDAFVPSGSGGLSAPLDPEFGPDGNLYVSSPGNGQVIEYGGSTGAFLGVVASGLSAANGITFGPDGSLYIVNQGANEVLRYNGSDLSPFVTTGSGGLGTPGKAAFGPDGNLYVNSLSTGQILRYSGQTGAFIDVFASTGSMPKPSWLAFGTDGYLYVSAWTTSVGPNKSILRFNATTGSLVDAFDLARDGWTFSLGAGNIIYDSANGAGGFIDRIGPASIAAFTVSLPYASATPVTVSYSTADGTALAGIDYVATSGTVTFAPGETTKVILVPTLNDAMAEGSETFTLTLSNPVGATIADGTGVGTITDDDATKFFVVNDGSPDQTYRYGAPGNGQATTALAAGNTAPRGAASTAAGDKVWVIDANKTVYVYSSAGMLLGSWAAGSLNANADVQGITVWGADVWLVDAKQGRVYRYAGAASRLSGSQNATSNFALNGSNSNPKDLVTDGINFWVVNDSTTDKVFKYTLAGSLVGSWTMSGGGGSPTGITLDPSGASPDLWVVDNATDKVYRYAAARPLASGTASAASAFTLNPLDTNPQGIADPPPAGDAVDPPPFGEPTPLLSVALSGNLMDRAVGPAIQPVADAPRREVRVALDRPRAEDEMPRGDATRKAPDDGFAFSPMFVSVDADSLLGPAVGGRVQSPHW